jgi:alkylation response protein AidB-like acyl-CoA dehydrogenase
MHFDQHVAVPDPAAGPEVYRQHARAWLRANLPDFMRSDSLDWRAPTLAESSAWEAAMYQAGLAGMTWPKPYGGHGLSLREHLAVNKEVGALPMPESVSSIGKELAGPIIMAVGTEAQKQAFLPNILSMKQYWCQGFSEPDAGSDLARLRTKAVQEGGQWRINGQKIWTSGAAKAHYCLLLTRTGTVADKHRGLLMFAVPMDTPGIRVVPIKSIDGKSSFAEVFFDDVVVPDSARLGAPDEGWSAAILPTCRQADRSPAPGARARQAGHRAEDRLHRERPGRRGLAHRRADGFGRGDRRHLPPPRRAARAVGRGPDRHRPCGLAADARPPAAQ